MIPNTQNTAPLQRGGETVKKGPRRPFLTIKSPGRERPMGTGAALRASIIRQRRTIRHCAPRNVFSATYTPPPKMIAVPFAPIGRETLRGFFDKLKPSRPGRLFSLYSKLACGADARAYEGADAHGGEGGRAGDQRRLGAFRPVERGAAQRQKQRERQRRGERPR